MATPHVPEPRPICTFRRFGGAALSVAGSARGVGERREEREQRLVGGGWPVLVDRDDPDRAAAPCGDGEREGIETGERDDVEAGRRRDAGEDAIRDHEVDRTRDEQQLFSGGDRNRQRAHSVEQRAAVARHRHLVDPPKARGARTALADRRRLDSFEDAPSCGVGCARERAVHGEQRCRCRRRERESSTGARDLENPRHRELEAVDRGSGRDRRAGTAAVPPVYVAHCRLDLVKRDAVERCAPEQCASVVARDASHDRVDLGRPELDARSCDVRALQETTRGRARRRGRGRLGGAFTRWVGQLARQTRLRPPRHAPPPSSRERRVAASTASSTADRNPCVSSSFSAAAVVPPGDVTVARSVSGASPLSASSAAAPISVWRTSASAWSRVRPTITPASIIASASRNRYAGPEPERPVTASRWGSDTRTTVPTEPRTRSALSTSSSVASEPAAMADAPLPTIAGRFGIALTTGRPGAACSSVAMLTPAAMERTRACSGNAVALAVSASTTSGGFTATTRRSTSAAAHAGLGTTRTPVSRLSR